jgi:hypothetical protein
MTYNDLLTTVANMTAYDPTDPNFVQIFPSMIDYAEDRIYRETNLLATVVRDSSATLTADSRNFTLPSGSGTFNVVYAINVYTPVGQTTVRHPLVPSSHYGIDTAWPSETAADTTTIPTTFAMITDQTLIVGPPPGDAYTVEIIGTIDPEPLSVTNQTTYLTETFPDLFLAACMVFMTGYMKNFGAQSDDPKMAQSWEGQYKTLFESVDLQNAQQKFQATSWTSEQPTKFAVPQRG